MSNAGLFATVAREYANFRPGYPPELFAWLARISPAQDSVWDCGCGSGQASIALAEHFAVVHATDVAPEQIAAAKSHSRVRYSSRAGRTQRSCGSVRGSGHRRPGAALVRCDGLLCRGSTRRPPGRAAGGVELPAATIRRTPSSTAVSSRFTPTCGRPVLAAGTPTHRIVVPDAAVSLRADGIAAVRHRARRGISSRWRATSAAGPPRARYRKALGTDPCRCCANRSPPPGRRTAPACRCGCRSACGSDAARPGS